MALAGLITLTLSSCVIGTTTLGGETTGTDTSGDGDGDGDGDGEGPTSGDGDGEGPTSGDGDGDPGSGDGDGEGPTSGDGDGDGDPATGDGDGENSEYPASCAGWLAGDPAASDGIYTIDPDGAEGRLEPLDVYCHMSKEGGGWTLVFVVSDDDQDTWTWNDRLLFSTQNTSVGDLAMIDHDFKSPAYHVLPFTDLLFIHQPSDVWALYGAVGDGSSSLANLVTTTDSPVCDYELAGEGYPLTAGTLLGAGDLCDTDLYFNLGDHDVDLDECMDFGSLSNTASFGPVWSADGGDGCPFDDPAEFGLGPHGPCGVCPDSFGDSEFDYLGFANALDLNTGAIGAAENYMQIYVR